MHLITNKAVEALFTKRFLMGWGIIVMILAIIPVHGNNQIDIPYIDKFAHIGIYMILAGLIYGYLIRNYNWSGFKTSFIAIVLAGSYGFFLELLQLSFLESRSFEIADIISNIIGSFIGIFITIIFFNSKK